MNQIRRESGIAKGVVSIRTATVVILQPVTIYSHMTTRGHRFYGLLSIVRDERGLSNCDLQTGRPNAEGAGVHLFLDGKGKRNSKFSEGSRSW
jgi:hypothetical protein